MILSWTFTPDTMKLLGSTEEKIPKDKNRDLQITEVISVQCKKVNNTYQHNSRALHPFIPDKLLG